MIGTVGGAIANALDLPLPWMIGAMVATTAAAVLGVPLAFSRALRTGMITILGVMLGSAFAPQLLDQIARWSFSLTALALYALVTTAASMAYFRSVARYDPITAYFCAVPGGLAEMTILGTALGGNERAISLTHAARILFTVLTIPVGFRFLESYDPAARTLAGQPLLAVGGEDLVILALCAVVGYLAARRLRLPAASILGPMMLSAAAHLTGLTTAQPPAELVAAAQVVAGSAIGARFAGTAAVTLLRLAIHALSATVIMVVLAILFAAGLHAGSGMPLPDLILALAPGGLAEMSLVALALHADAAFVSTHHVARISMVVAMAPALHRLLPGRWRKPAGPAAAD
ncbi:MAG TPA: AbrB family transcriptional regulator [Alphaproteobacteria bacterium]|nr:AbrB family transcriptional regulator [Alphaproteobacteria bacterium]